MALKPKVVVSLLTDQQDFQLKQAEDARAAASRAAIDIEVIFADSNAVLQIHQLFGYVNATKDKRPTAIVVESVAADGLERVARAAVQVGIGWVLLSSHAPYLDLLHKEFPALLISSATADDEEIGRIQARHFQAILPNGGNLLCIEGPAVSATTQLRRRAMEEGILRSRIKIGKTLNADWTQAGAERVVSAWLRLRSDPSLRPDLVGAQNDTMGVGARQAILAHRREWADVPITGCDGLPEGGQRLVKEGVLAATVVKPTTAGAGVELVARASRRDSLPPPVILLPRSYPSLEDLAARFAKRSQ